jgi:NADH:ubiquinone reductase (H+-translocating)
VPLNIPQSTKPRLVIIGAGFAGFTLARKLAGKEYQIVLLDRNNYHQFQPLYYQVAMSGLEPSSICFPLRRSFQEEKDFYVRVAEVNKILPEEKKIETSMGIIRFDLLVLAMGAKTNYYGNAEFEANSIPLKSVSESLFLRNQILSDLEKAVMSPEGTDLSPLLDIVIVGGGPTGVELAGALAEMKQHVIPKDYPDLDAKKMHIHLIQGTDRLLPGMSVKSSAKAKSDLEQLGVTLYLDQQVKNISDGKVILDNGFCINANKVIWAAGVSASSIPGLPESSISRSGRILTDEYCRVRDTKDIFAIGDLALVQAQKFPNGHPQVAPAALQQAKWLAGYLSKKISTPFEYFDKGSMATIGRHKAVVDVAGRHISGFFAWIIWLFVHIYYLIGVKNKIIVLLNWIWGYIFYDQALRLLIKPKTSKKELV